MAVEILLGDSAQEVVELRRLRKGSANTRRDRRRDRRRKDEA